MKNSSNLEHSTNSRREFLKNSAQLATLSLLGFNTLLNAKESKNSLHFTNKALQGEQIPALGYGAFSKDFHFKPFSFTRHPMGANDVLIEIYYCGVCHSDLHSIKGDFHPALYPMVPGHEIAGVVVAVGSKVKKFKVGDYAGVGCMVNSCGECEACKASQ